VVGLPPAATLLVAVSGGQDSVCLLNGLVEAARQAEDGPRLVVVHLDHCLRGDRSSEDAAAVEELARAYGLEAAIWRADVSRYARANRLGLEEAGRFARYQVLRVEAARRLAWGAATAHTADDQAESVVMNLLRGSGLAGLAGIAPSLDYSEGQLGPVLPETQVGPPTPSSTLRVIRPLLGLPRSDTAKYCRALGLAVRPDESNLDPTHLRNRVRHHLIPLLLSYNPSIRAGLASLAAVVSEEASELERLTEAAWSRLARLSGAEVAFSWVDWQALSPSLQRRLLRRAGQQLTGRQGWSFRSVEAGRRLLEQRLPARQLSLADGVRLSTTRQGFKLRRRPNPQVPPAEGGQLEATACSKTSNRS
jgi:tRNA(Ile)-lysidine synthase